MKWLLQSVLQHRLYCCFLTIEKWAATTVEANEIDNGHDYSSLFALMEKLSAAFLERTIWGWGWQWRQQSCCSCSAAFSTAATISSVSSTGTSSLAAPRVLCYSLFQDSTVRAQVNLCGWQWRQESCFGNVDDGRRGQEHCCPLRVLIIKGDVPLFHCHHCEKNNAIPAPTKFSFYCYVMRTTNLLL